MNEQDWHKATREKLARRLQKQFFRVEHSHGGRSELGLYRGSKSEANHLSDADIIMFSSPKRICRIIEIESYINPKKLIGIVVATHLSTTCHRADDRGKRRDEEYPLSRIRLEIQYRRPIEGASTLAKLEMISGPLKKMIKTYKGCLVDFGWKPI